MKIDYLAGVFDACGIVRFQVLDSGKVVKKELYLHHTNDNIVWAFKEKFGGEVREAGSGCYWVLRDEYRMRKALKELKRRSFVKKESFGLMQKVLNTVKDCSKTGKPLTEGKVARRIRLAQDLAILESNPVLSKRAMEKFEKILSAPCSRVD